MWSCTIGVADDAGGEPDHGRRRLQEDSGDRRQVRQVSRPRLKRISYLSFIYKVMKKLADKGQFKDLVLTLDYNEYFSKPHA